MTYKLVAKSHDKKETKEVTGVPALHAALSEFRRRGMKVRKIERVLQ